MALIKNHDKTGIENAYINIRQINATKGNLSIIMDVYKSKEARAAGKSPIDEPIELSGPHDLNGVGNLWEKGYGIAKLDERLAGATDDK